MKRILFILITFNLIVLDLRAQEPLSLPSVDTQTYSLWLKKDWKSLIKLGKQSLKNNIDFYYLRVRMGIAYYEQKNYHMAIHHFEKAYKVNSQEVYLKEYLYYSYLFAGRYSDASVLASTFHFSLQEKVGVSNDSFIDQVSLFCVSSFLTDNNAIDNYPAEFNPSNDGYQEITRKYGLYSIGLLHNLNPRFSLSHTYTNIQKNSFEFIVNSGTEKILDNQKTTVHQYYIAGNSRVAKGLNFGFGAHILNIRYPVDDSFFRQGQYYTTTQIVSFTDAVGFLSAHKNFTYLTLGSALSLANLNSATQVQGDIILSFFPLGNLTLYSTSMASYQREIYSNQSYDDAVVFNQLLGFRVNRFLWAECFATIGSMKNFIANNGATIYNGAEVINGRLGGRLIILLKPYFSLITTYTSVSKQSTFIEINNINTSYNPIDYTNHSITGGLIWNF
jgi:tetratricopeptide (TPR) repeat protein